MDKKTRKEILKGWKEHKGFELFKEDITILLNKNRDSLAKLDLFDESHRAKGVKIQSNINAINDVINYIDSYSNQARIIGGIDIDNI